MPTVIIYWSPGRSAEQKARVSERIYQSLVEEGGARPEDVLIIFQNIEQGDSYRPGVNGANSSASSASAPAPASPTEADGGYGD